MEAGQWRGMDKEKATQDQAAAQGSAKVAPKPYMSAQYKEDKMRTTGDAISHDVVAVSELYQIEFCLSRPSTGSCIRGLNNLLACK